MKTRATAPNWRKIKKIADFLTQLQPRKHCSLSALFRLYREIH